jgi:hypothetical protein
MSETEFPELVEKYALLHSLRTGPHFPGDLIDAECARRLREGERPKRETREAYNSRAKPFVWTKDADEILRKVRKIQQMLATS